MCQNAPSRAEFRDIAWATFDRADLYDRGAFPNSA